MVEVTEKSGRDVRSGQNRQEAGAVKLHKSEVVQSP